MKHEQLKTKSSYYRIPKYQSKFQPTRSISVRLSNEQTAKENTTFLHRNTIRHQKHLCDIISLSIQLLKPCKFKTNCSCPNQLSQMYWGEKWKMSERCLKQNSWGKKMERKLDGCFFFSLLLEVLPGLQSETARCCGVSSSSSSSDCSQARLQAGPGRSRGPG